MDLAEIRLIFEGVRRAAERDVKTRCAQNYQIAVLTATMVNCALAGKDFPTLGRVFPDLFPPTEAEMTALVEQFKVYAAAYNEQRAKETNNES